MDFWRMRTLMRQMQADERNVEAAFARATQITAGFSDSPRAPGISDKVGRGALEYEEAKRVLAETVKELEALREELRGKMGVLPENCQMVMRARYIDGETPNMVAIHCHYSIQHVFRLLRQGEMALQDV